MRILFAVVFCLTLAAGAFAVWREYASFPPSLRGFGEVTRRGEVAGWAVGPASPGERVEVQLYVDGRFVAQGEAALPRPDVLAAGRSADANCGYRFALQDRKSTRLNSSHGYISYAVFCLKKKKT